MRIAQAVYSIPALFWGKQPKVTMDDMELKFENPYEKTEPEMTAEKYSAKARARWFAFLGMNQGNKK